MRPDKAERGRLVACERALLDAVAAARAKGISLVYGAFKIEIHDEVLGRVVGCCALAAADMAKAPTIHLAPDDNDKLAREWDAIECGFDGVTYKDAARVIDKSIDPANDIFAWWDLGTRLRRKLHPINSDLFAVWGEVTSLV